MLRARKVRQITGSSGRAAARRLLLGLGHGIGHLDGCAAAGSRHALVRGQRLLGHDVVDLSEDALECLLYVGGLQGGGLNKGQTLLLAECLGVLCLNRPQVTQVAFVTDQHDHNVAVGVVPQLLQPPLNVLKGY